LAAASDRERFLNDLVYSSFVARTLFASEVSIENFDVSFLHVWFRVQLQEWTLPGFDGVRECFSKGLVIRILRMFETCFLGMFNPVFSQQ